MPYLGELFRTLRAHQETQDELDAHGDVIQVLNYFERIWTGPSKYINIFYNLFFGGSALLIRIRILLYTLIPIRILLSFRYGSESNCLIRIRIHTVSKR
jgi:hypothetical protein